MTSTLPDIERTREKPGPGPVPAGLLRALDLRVARRTTSLADGDHRAARLGRGSELAQVRPYADGDDVRRIDWNATARHNELHVRVDVAERAVSTWLLLDVSPSMTFGTGRRRKADVVEGVGLALAHITSRRGNRVGALTFGGTRPIAVPQRQGRRGLVGALLAARQEPETDQVGATSLGAALDRLSALARQRGVVFVVSDFLGPRDWREPLLRLASRHEVSAVEIRDRREHELPDVGHLWLVDPETGRRIQVDTRRRKTRTAFAAAAEADRADVARELASVGVAHCTLSTDEDWLRSLGSFLTREHRRRR
jgi:uncharacterized protein (DUF58 family)